VDRPAPVGSLVDPGGRFERDTGLWRGGCGCLPVRARHDVVVEPVAEPVELVSSLEPRVKLRFAPGSLVVEVFETLDGDPHWAPLAVDDLVADLVALGWSLPDVEPVDGGVEFLRVTHDGLRAEVDGRQVSATDAVHALVRGLFDAVLRGAEADAERVAQADAALAADGTVAPHTAPPSSAPRHGA